MRISLKPRIALSGRAQLVAHVGQEFALQPRDLGDLRIGDLDLSLLRRDLAELGALRCVQPRVVDADGGLAGDDPHQRLFDAGEGLHLATRQSESADETLGRLERHHQTGPRRVRETQGFEAPVLGGIRDRDELAALRCPAHDALTELESSDLTEVVGEWVRGDSGQGTTVLIEEEDRGSIAVDQVGGGLEHEVDRLLQLQTRREEVSDLAQKVDNDLVVHRRAEYTCEFRRQRTVGQLQSIQRSAHDRRLCSSSTSAGSTFKASPTTPRSASLKIGAFSSLLTATIAFAPFIPTVCCIAPLMPNAR